METKTVNLIYHADTENKKRRVKYGDRNSFSKLIVSFTDGNVTRVFQFDSKDLPDQDSIHLNYEPETKSISWSPAEMNSKVIEL